MATAMLAFMRTGNPANSDLPDWPRYDAAAGQTMILNTVCEVKRDPDREARASLPT
jgi:para-nitrobenzyl esterase